MLNYSMLTYLAGLMMIGIPNVLANCYSCSPCQDVPWYQKITGDPTGKVSCSGYCMKIDGSSSSGQSVVVKGCPIVLNTLTSGFSSMVEGCIRGKRDVPGVGSVTGEICICNGELCNRASPLLPSFYISASAILLSQFFFKFCF